MLEQAPALKMRSATKITSNSNLSPLVMAHELKYPARNETLYIFSTKSAQSA
jgi:hypothetical protein